MEEQNKMEIAERLWDYMKQNPMSSVKIAAKIGIGRTTLLGIVHDNVIPRNEVRCKIEKFLITSQQKQDGR